MGDKWAAMRVACDSATPEPWYAEECRVWGDRALGQQSNEIAYRHKVADCTYHADGGFEQTKADAEFIAAAREAIPALLAERDEILAAFKGLVGHLAPIGPETSGILKAARAAIDKAEGK